MLVRQFTLKLNAGASVNPVIYTNQNDYGELWCFTLINGTEVITPSEGTLIGLSSGGQTYAVDGYVDELGRACITETTEITSTPGRGEYELSIGGHGTANFYVETEARPTDGIVVSEDEMDYFDSVVEQTGANAQAAQTAAEQVVAYTDFSTRTEKANPDLTDIIPMQTADGTAVKIDYDQLAEAIIERYSDSALGSTLLTAIESLNSRFYKNTINESTFEFDVNRVREGTEENPGYRYYSMLMYGCVSGAYPTTTGKFMYLVFAGVDVVTDLVFVPIITGSRTFTGTITNNHVVINASAVVYGGIYVICL